MRKYLSLITDHPDESKVGKIESADKPLVSIEKNEERPVHRRDVDTEAEELGEQWTEQHVGLGYVDFEDEDDYRENFADAAIRKLNEIDEEHVENAGIAEVVFA